MQNVETGMTVRSSDGDKLGKIIEVRGDQIIIEKGIFFPKDYTAPLTDVQSVTDDGVYLKWGTNLVETNYDALYGTGTYGQETETGDWIDYRARASGKKAGRKTKEARIPIQEEQLRATKKGMKDVGKVRIHKSVRTEEQHFTVPVRREEVTVERAAGGEAQPGAEAGAFKENTETFPIREEQVEITKRPVTTEEVRVQTHEVEEERPVSGEVRKEEVHVDKDTPR